jgi:hypothetical protein
MPHGTTPLEIAVKLRLPNAQAGRWFVFSEYCPGLAWFFSECGINAAIDIGGVRGWRTAAQKLKSEF